MDKCLKVNPVRRMFATNGIDLQTKDKYASGKPTRALIYLPPEQRKSPFVVLPLRYVVKLCSRILLNSRLVAFLENLPL